jgi:hypothetical protein
VNNKADIFQEDETSRASALGSLVSALEKPEEFLIASTILGYELSEEVEDAIEAMIAKKAEASATIQEQMKPAAPAPVEEQPVENEVEPPDSSEKAILEELAKFKRKALHNIGKPFRFDFDAIPLEMVKALKSSLIALKTEAEVLELFEGAKNNITGEADNAISITPAPDYAPLLEGIKSAVDALKISERANPAPQISVTVNNAAQEPPPVA